MKDMIEVEIKRHGKEEHELLWFYERDGEYRYCIGCIYDYQYQRDDFKWLFDFVINLHWKLQKFSNCRVEETEDRWEDWLDSYCNKTFTHTFMDKRLKFETHINDMSDSENCDIQDVFNFINSNSEVEFKIIKRY